MKFLYLFFFLLTLSCDTVKKEYICGDQPCKNKKEFSKYFSQNLTIEIATQKNKKNKVPSLVKLNTESLDKIKNDFKKIKKQPKIKLINKKDQAVDGKIKLLEEQNVNEINEINKTNEETNAKKSSVPKEVSSNVKVTEISNDREEEKELNNKVSLDNKKKIIKKFKKGKLFESVKIENINNICDEIKDCDIDKIADLLIKKGRDKSFPDISSN